MFSSIFLLLSASSDGLSIKMCISNRYLESSASWGRLSYLLSLLSIIERRVVNVLKRSENVKMFMHFTVSLQLSVDALYFKIQYL